MFEFLNPFRHFQAKKRARLEAEKQIAIRKAKREEAEREAKRRQEYADHLQELRGIVRQPRVYAVEKTRNREQDYQPTFSQPDAVANLLNTISEQSRVTSFEMGSTDMGTLDRSDCSPASDTSSSTSDSGNSCNPSD